MDQLLSAIRKEEIIRLTQQLVRIPSPNPPGKEEDVSNFLDESLRALGFKVRMDEVRPGRPNVIATLSRGKEGKRIMFNGHLDVVPSGERSLWETDPFSGELRDSRIYGRGSTDMKGGIAAVLSAMKALADSTNDFRGEVMFTGVVDEETEGLGTMNLVERGYRADMAIVAEPTDGTIGIAHKGSLWFEATTYGVAKHSSQVTSKDSANAIYRMVRVIETIEGMLPGMEERSDDLVGNPTISVGVIEGGTKANIVPDRCRIVVDRRLLPEDSPKEAMDAVRRSLSKLSDDDPEFKVDLRVLVAREGARISPKEEVVRIASKAIHQALSKEPVVGGMRATTDMAILVNSGGIPTIIYGPGSIKEAHIPNEFVEVEELLNASRVYGAILHNTLAAD